MTATGRRRGASIRSSSATCPQWQAPARANVENPAYELERIFAYLGLENEAEAVNYGKTKMKAGMGDPINVGKHNKPTTKSVAKWANELASSPAKLALAEDMIARVADADLKE